MGVASAHEPWIAGLLEKPVEPVIIAEADAKDQIRATYLLGITGLRLERLGVDGRRHDRVDFDKLAANRFGKRPEVGRGRDDPYHRLAWRREEKDRNRENRQSHVSESLPRCSWAQGNARC